MLRQSYLSRLWARGQATLYFQMKKKMPHSQIGKHQKGSQLATGYDSQRLVVIHVDPMIAPKSVVFLKTFNSLSARLGVIAVAKPNNTRK